MVIRLTLVACALPSALAFGFAPAVNKAQRSSSRSGVESVQAIASLIPPAQNAAADIGDVLPDCPNTIWNENDIDVAEWQKIYKSEDDVTCPIEIHASAEDNAEGVAYFERRREELQEILAKHGTIWFRGFDLMKDPVGFRDYWEALQLDPCLDPIHSSGLRKFLSKRDAVYEEVNKQTLSKHYIGLHNEATHKKTATTGAFVCFKPATVSGGEFMIADGEKIFRDMPADILQTLLDREVRISVSNLDLDMLGVVPGDGKEAAMEKVRGLVAEKVAPKFDMDLDMVWGADGNDMRLQAIENSQKPVNRHPKTGRPVWFCNIHNHARFLRDRRPCSVPEVGMTDVYFGDLSLIPGEMLNEINRVCEQNIVRVPMEAGDVLMCDNYRVLHGRDIFEGDRLHAVSWFGEGVQLKADRENGDVLNAFINKFVVGD